MKRAISLGLLCGVVLLSCGQNGQQGAAGDDNSKKDAPDGKALFANYCMQCHALNEDKVGPKLAGVLGRWNNDTTLVVDFVKNSESLINQNNPYAMKVYNAWGKAAMPAFTSLTDAHIKEIVKYVNGGVE